MRLCVLGFGFWLRPAIPGWGVGLCVFVCALRLYRANPGWGSWCVLVGSGFGFQPANPGWAVGSVCVSVRAPPVGRNSGLGCAVWVCVLGVRFWLRPAVPVFVCAVLLHPANPGCGFGACVVVRALRLYRAIPCSGVRCGCVCLGSGFGYAPPSLAGMLGCVCLCARSACTPPILAGVCGACVGLRLWPSARQSWLGC